MEVRKNMKKITSILLVLLVALSALPMALAEDDNTTDDDIENETDDNLEEETETEDDEDETEEAENETEEETETMNTPYGAEVRLLQLEIAIDRNILKGLKIAEEAENATELQAIIEEMKALKTEVQNADPSAEDAVQVFVDLKKDARDLSKKFRDAARALIKEDKRAAIKEKIKNLENKELKEKVRAKIRAFNAQRMQDLYSTLGLGEDIVEKIRNGNMTAKEARDQMKEALKTMTKEEMSELYQQMKEKKIERRVEAKAKLAELKEQFSERKEQREENRASRIKGGRQ